MDPTGQLAGNIATTHGECLFKAMGDFNDRCILWDSTNNVMVKSGKPVQYSLLISANLFTYMGHSCRCLIIRPLCYKQLSTAVLIVMLNVIIVQ